MKKPVSRGASRSDAVNAGLQDAGRGTSTGVSSWTTIVPEVPPSANELLRKYRHHAVFKKLRLYWGWMLIKAGAKNIPQATDMRVLRIMQHRTRLIDRANCWLGADKLICDPLVKFKVLVDDSEKWVDIDVVQVKDTEEKTVIEISEVQWHKP